MKFHIPLNEDKFVKCMSAYLKISDERADFFDRLAINLMTNGEHDNAGSVLTEMSKHVETIEECYFVGCVVYAAERVVKRDADFLEKRN